MLLYAYTSVCNLSITIQHICIHFMDKKANGMDVPLDTLLVKLKTVFTANHLAIDSCFTDKAKEHLQVKQSYCE